MEKVAVWSTRSHISHQSLIKAASPACCRKVASWQSWRFVSWQPHFLIYCQYIFVLIEYLWPFFGQCQGRFKVIGQCHNVIEVEHFEQILSGSVLGNHSRSIFWGCIFSTTYPMPGFFFSQWGIFAWQTSQTVHMSRFQLLAEQVLRHLGRQLNFEAPKWSTHWGCGYPSSCVSTQPTSRYTVSYMIRTCAIRKELS